MSLRKKKGPRIDPWGIPIFTGMDVNASNGNSSGIVVPVVLTVVFIIVMIAIAVWMYKYKVCILLTVTVLSRVYIIIYSKRTSI